MRVLLLGATDTTLAVAKSLEQVPDIELAGLATLPERPTISYAKDGLPVERRAPLEEWASARHLSVLTSADADEVLAFAEHRSANACVVAGWYHMVPRRLREHFKAGCLGVHASLLPELRGGAPLAWAILADLPRTGVSVFALGDGVDDGPLYGQVEIPIGPRDRVGELIVRANEAAGPLVAGILAGISRGSAAPVPQSGLPTYGLQRQEGDGRIDWRQSSVDIDRLVRASGMPYRGAFTFYNGERVRVWRSELVEDAPVVHGSPGQIARMPWSDFPVVITGDGLLALCAATDDRGQDALPRLVGQTRFGSSAVEG